jgi:hypothetical protein
MVPSPPAKTSNADRAVIDFGHCANASARRGTADFRCSDTVGKFHAPLPKAHKLASARGLYKAPCG